MKLAHMMAHVSRLALFVAPVRLSRNLSSRPSRLQAELALLAAVMTTTAPEPGSASNWVGVGVGPGSSSLSVTVTAESAVEAKRH